MEQAYDFPFGKAFCSTNYVYFERGKGHDLSVMDAKVLMDQIYEHFGTKKFVYISHRKTITKIDLKTYDLIKKKQIVGIAIVSQNIDPEFELIKEQERYDGSFAFFKTLDQAIAWAATFEV